MKDKEKAQNVEHRNIDSSRVNPAEVIFINKKLKILSIETLSS